MLAPAAQPGSLFRFSAGIYVPVGLAEPRFGMDMRSDDRVVALMLASDDSGCRIVSDWDVRDVPSRLSVEVTWWP